MRIGVTLSVGVQLQMAWSNVVGLGSSSSRQPLARRYSSSGSSSGVPYLAIHGAEALSVITSMLTGGTASTTPRCCSVGTVCLVSSNQIVDALGGLTLCARTTRNRP
jgi:hypothetical protein